MRFIIADLERNLVLIWIKKAICCKDINKNNALGVIQNGCFLTHYNSVKKNRKTKYCFQNDWICIIKRSLLDRGEG
jgi:hypothetical protein